MRFSPTTITPATWPGWTLTRPSTSPSALTKPTTTRSSATKRPSRPSSTCGTMKPAQSSPPSARTCRRSRTICPSIRSIAIPSWERRRRSGWWTRFSAAGDGNHGVATAAYNLPNDERVVNQKGSKRVMLKNVQEAKFRSVLIPIARRMLPRSARDVNFESFFTHIVAHELMHGLGPHQIKVDGRDTTPRAELKELYSAIEEAKADITGLFALQYMMDHAQEMKLSSVLPSDEAAQRQLYTTYLASMFRSLRFGLNDAHGKGMAIQFNYLMDKGAFTQQADQTFALDLEKFKTGSARPGPRSADPRGPGRLRRRQEVAG